MNGLAACLEYGTSSWMCISDGHNGIWTYWAFLQIPTWPKPKTKNFLLWITSNRLCLHVGPEFWTIFSFTCSESTSFATCKFCLYTLYITDTSAKPDIIYIGRFLGSRTTELHTAKFCCAKCRHFSHSVASLPFSTFLHYTYPHENIIIRIVQIFDTCCGKSFGYPKSPC